MASARQLVGIAQVGEVNASLARSSLTKTTILQWKPNQSQAEKLRAWREKMGFAEDAKVNLLCNFQRIHDKTDNISWEEEFANAARTYNLKYTPPSE
jgi:hypothetical protein